MGKFVLVLSALMLAGCDTMPGPIPTPDGPTLASVQDVCGATAAEVQTGIRSIEIARDNGLTSFEALDALHTDCARRSEIEAQYIQCRSCAIEMVAYVYD